MPLRAMPSQPMHVARTQHLLDVRDETTVLEDGEDFRRQRRESILGGIVEHDAVLEVDRDFVARLDRVSTPPSLGE